MRVLLLFLDGIGLGDSDPTINPFASAAMPTIQNLTNGHRWLASTGRQETDRSLFVPIDPRLGVAGRPQSGSSQAALLTGLNVPSVIGKHYGPKPDEETRNIIAGDNLFIRLRNQGYRTALLDAYPPRLLADIARGKTLPSSIQQAAIESGQSLFTLDDLIAGDALTAEWTGEPWRRYLKIDTTPVYSPEAAGRKLAELAQQYDFAMHSHWMTDYVGHRGPLERGVELLEIFDGVMKGLLSSWNDEEGVIIITSDHGNMEHIGDRKHTENDVPGLIIGSARHEFNHIRTLTDFAPVIESLITRQVPTTEP